MNDVKKWNRRSILLGFAGTATWSSSSRAGSQSATPESSTGFTWPTPVDIGEGLSVLDWRVHPGTDGPRLMIELRNDREDAMYSPAISYRLPDYEPELLWAVPWEPVLQPRSSTVLVAQLPKGYGPADEISLIGGWELCDTVQSVDPGVLDALEAVRIDDLQSEPWHGGRHYWGSLINTSPNRLPHRRVTAVVRAPDGRLAGVVNVADVLLSDSEPQSFHVWIVGNQESSPLEPTVLLDDPLDMKTEFRIQPRGDAIAPGCPAIMPWGQKN